MSLDKHNSGAIANGFLPHTLLKEEAVPLHEAHYLALPDMRAPHGWALSINDILVWDPPTPMSRGWGDAPLLGHAHCRAAPVVVHPTAAGARLLG